MTQTQKVRLREISVWIVVFATILTFSHLNWALAAWGTFFVVLGRAMQWSAARYLSSRRKPRPVG